jgi:chromosome segregation ATPase
VAHNVEKAETTVPATGQQPRWVNQWTVYALGGATAIALILAVTGWNKASSYQEQANDLRSQVNDLKTQVTAAQGQANAAQGQATGLQAQVKDLQGQVATVSGERDALKPLQTQVASLEQQIDGFGVERSQMLNERNSVVQRLGAAASARDVSDNHIVSLEKELARVTSERDDLIPLVDEVAQLEQQRSNLLAERNALVQQVGGVAWARDIAIAKLDDLNKERNAMAAQRDRIAADIATIEKSVGSKEELTGQVTRLQAEAKEVEGQLANLTAQRDAVTAEIARSENRVSELQKAADLAGQNLAAIGSEVAQRTQALNTLRQQQQEATRQAEAAKAVFLDAEKQLTMLRDQMVNQAEVLRAAAKPAVGEKDASTMPATNNADNGAPAEAVK